MGVRTCRIDERLDAARLVRMKPGEPKPRKPRRRQAPIEPGLPEPEIEAETDDPRGALYKAHRRKTIRTPCHDPHGAGMIETQAHAGKPADAATGAESAQVPRYAELHCVSNFSFQRGASSARELFERAKALGYDALAITDECSLAGIVRALEVAEETNVALIVGTEMTLDDGLKLVVLAKNHDGYSDICRLITTGRRRSKKGEYRLARADAEALGDGVAVLWIPRGSETAAHDDEARWIVRHFGGRAWLAAELHRSGDDAGKLAMLSALGVRHALPLIAAGDVHMHVRKRRALQDVMTAIRLGCTIAEAGHALFPNGERHLRRVDDLEALYPRALLDETLRVAALCTLNLRKLKYRYPHELVPDGQSAIEYLRELTYAGARRRWPDGIPAEVAKQVEKELSLIESLEYEHFFLTVEEIVRWATTRDPPILCQGRGSSANSAVCYCLGITAVNPDNGNLLFERFLSKERREPPDIDVDFEHERREEVIQHVFEKYGRDRAALAATVISYRGKSAVRDVGRALGLPDDQLDVLAGLFSRVRSGKSLESQLSERGFDPQSRTIQRLFRLAEAIRGFPRHLSQHVGGFVISEGPLHHLVPIENAAMEDRTIIQWDKDDLEELGLLKVDCLALGMLTCLRKCFDLLHANGLWTHRTIGLRPRLVDLPRNDDPEVYAMIQTADTIGVFQIESRAQMSMLPRLKPRCFYDLVVEIAIVRPGPIQGQMVHPYLRRRKGEKFEYPLSKYERENGIATSIIQSVLNRTLGVPIFQEQVMKLIEVIAGFTPGEADELRRAMAAWKRRGGLDRFHDKIRDGMLERGYDEDYFQRIFEQIKGFGEYGFTGQMHADDVRLIHMGGRVYDYQLGRFLSVDPVIGGLSSQSLNPYSYLMNNPLSGTDPSGYAIECQDDNNCTLSDVARWGVTKDSNGKAILVATDNKGNMVNVSQINSFTENGGTKVTAINQGTLQAAASRDPSAINSISSLIGTQGVGTAGGSNYNKELGNHLAAAYFGGFAKQSIEGAALVAACGNSPMAGAACMAFGLGQSAAHDPQGAAFIAAGAGAGALSRSEAAAEETAAASVQGIRGPTTEAETEAAAPIAPYDRSLYGGSQTTSQAAQDLRAANEGQPCPSCGTSQVSGTPSAPSPQHDPPLVKHYYENGGAQMTDAQRRSYGRSPEAFNGTQCLTCQRREGAALSRYSREKAKGLATDGGN
jgi:error-prone DNA polymerase